MRETVVERKRVPRSGRSPRSGTRETDSVSCSTSSPPTTTVNPSGTVATLDKRFSWRGGGSVASDASPVKLDSAMSYSTRS